MQGAPITESPQNTVRSKWLEQRRDHFIRQLVDDFFLQVESFQQLYSVYLDCRNLGDHVCVDLLSPATEVARGQIWYRLTQMIGTETEKGQLWQLKDLCHLIWPAQEQQRDVHGALIDWLLGSIFHEAMKLKENIYLLNTYGPRFYAHPDLFPNSQASWMWRHLYAELRKMWSVRWNKSDCSWDRPILFYE